MQLLPTIPFLSGFDIKTPVSKPNFQTSSFLFSDILDVKYVEILEVMNYIDFEISEVIKDLPDVINKASVEIIASRRKSNFNDFGFAAGLSLGKLLQVL